MDAVLAYIKQQNFAVHAGSLSRNVKLGRSQGKLAAIVEAAGDLLENGKYARLKTAATAAAGAGGEKEKQLAFATAVVRARSASAGARKAATSAAARLFSVRFDKIGRALRSQVIGCTTEEAIVRAFGTPSIQTLTNMASWNVRGASARAENTQCC